jgi:hypothetical protein
MYCCEAENSFRICSLSLVANEAKPRLYLSNRARGRCLRPLATEYPTPLRVDGLRELDLLRLLLLGLPYADLQHAVLVASPSCRGCRTS